MDYEQHMYGRSSYDPTRARGQMHREGGVGGVLLLVGVIVAALAPLCPGGEDAILCEDAVERTLAAARTIRRRVEATAFMEFGETLEETNF